MSAATYRTLTCSSAARAGYYNDPFISLFCRRTGRRSPLINRGYFARVAAVDLILRRFTAVARRTGDGRSQIVSLGAGFDSTFFRLSADGCKPSLYIEVDFPDVTARKAAIFEKHAVLTTHIGGGPSGSSGNDKRHGASFAPNAAGGVDVIGDGFRLITADLRDVAAVQAALRAAGIDTSLPTLFLSECVLVYLEPEESCAIIAWAAATFPRSTFVTYEQIRPHDAFGQVMARNLEERGYSLRGLTAFPDIATQTARYRQLGYAAATVADMNDIYYRMLPRSEVARIERLELFDEVEEWHLMSAHYCIAVAVNEVSPPPPQRQPSRAGSHKSHANARAGSTAATPSQVRTDVVATTVASTAAAKAASVSQPPHPSPARVYASDMPAPAPKQPRSSSASSSVALAIPAPTTAAMTADVSMSSTSAPTPRDLAAAVVALHEGQQAALHPHHSFSSSASLRGPSPSPSLSSVGGGPHGGRGSHSRSQSFAGSEAEVEVVAALEAASNSAVHSMELFSPRGSRVSTSPRVTAIPQLLHTASRQQSMSISDDTPLTSTWGGRRTASTPGSVVGGGGVSRSSPSFHSNASVSQSLGGGGSQSGQHQSSAVIHTHGGDVHIMTGTRGDGSGLPSVDFSAIAAAEGEMTAARHLRESVGADVHRDADVSVVSAGGGQQPHRRGGSATRSPADSGAENAALPLHASPGLYAPAVEGSRAVMARSTHVARAAYDATSVDTLPQPISLFAMLLHVAEWADAGQSMSTSSQA